MVFFFSRFAIAYLFHNFCPHNSQDRSRHNPELHQSMSHHSDKDWDHIGCYLQRKQTFSISLVHRKKCHSIISGIVRAYKIHLPVQMCQNCIWKKKRKINFNKNKFKEFLWPVLHRRRDQIITVAPTGLTIYESVKTGIRKFSIYGLSFHVPKAMNTGDTITNRLYECCTKLVRRRLNLQPWAKDRNYT